MSQLQDSNDYKEYLILANVHFNYCDQVIVLTESFFPCTVRHFTSAYIFKYDL